jgi:hypothetical protein
MKSGMCRSPSFRFSKYLHKKNAGGRAESTGADRRQDELQNEQKPDRWAKNVARHLGQEREDAVGVFKFPKLVVEDLPDEIVDASGGE